MTRKVSIPPQAIKKHLQSYDYCSSILEYIENGLDAKAKNIVVDFKESGLGIVEEITIEDDGTGIDYQKIDEKFGKFLASEKTKIKHLSDTSGKDGIGRLTFYCFADSAEWLTKFINLDGEYQEYKILVHKDAIDDYDPVDLKPASGEKTGTKVKFTHINDHQISAYKIKTELKKEIMEKISWRFILLKASLRIGNEDIDFSEMIQHQEERFVDLEGIKFSARIIKWNEKQKEPSMYYFIDSEGVERYKTTTGKNRQGDDFHHSVYVDSTFFNDFVFIPGDGETLPNNVLKLDLDNKSTPNPTHPTFKSLIKYLAEEVRAIRKPFIEKEAKEYIKSLEEEKIIQFSEDPIPKLVNETTKEIVESIYLYSPKFLKDQSDEQKGVFIKLIHTIIEDGKSSSVFAILDHVLKLSKEERYEFAQILEDIPLSNILKTIKLIEDRLTTIKVLEQMVYNEALEADEVHDLQGIIAEHYWLFGEEFAFLSEAEPDMEECLNRYIFHRKGFKTEKAYIAHKDKNKEMDLFVSRIDRYKIDGEDHLLNVVVEIKHPSINVGKDECDQVWKYMDVVASDPRFLGKGVEWKFLLIGKKHNKEVDSKLDGGKEKGRSIIDTVPSKNITIYYKDWSEILSENKTRLEFLRKKLELKQQTIHKNAKVNNKQEGKNKLQNSASLESDFSYTK